MPYARNSDRRIFAGALAASAAIHALVLAAAPAWESASRVPGRIIARLVESPPLAQPRQPVPVQAEERKPEPLVRGKAARVPERLLPAAQPVPAEPAPEVAVARSEPRPLPSEDRGERPGSGAGAGAEAPRQAAEADSFAKYRLLVISEAGRHRRYPPLARERGWEGDVVVRIAVSANGTIASLSVKSSSGYEVLDEQALEMFRKAAARVPVPPALQGMEFAVDVRAIYNLKDQASG